MVNCTHCNAYRHCYCLDVVPSKMIHEWCCYECLKKDNGDTKSIQGENSKVKPIPSQEVALMSMLAAHNFPRLVVRRKRTPQKMKCISPRRQVHLASPPSMKCISPSTQVHHASPPNVKPSASKKRILPNRQTRPVFPLSRKQSSGMKHVSPSRSDNQVSALKRYVVASQKQIKVEDRNKRQKVQSGATIPMITYNRKGKVKNNDHQLQGQPKEKKVASAADKGKCNSWVGDQPTGKMAFNGSVPTYADIGCGSGTKCLNNNIDMPVIINSSAEYARRPPPEAICWTGCFLLSDGEKFNLGEFKAYHPSRVSPRVFNIAKKMPSNMQLKISPRKNYWPKTFEKISPVFEDIALLFFPAEPNCCYKKHPRLLDRCCGFVMHAYIDHMMLLIYSSEVLPPDCQWIDGKSYLWGVFVKPKAKSNHARLGSVST